MCVWVCVAVTICVQRWLYCWAGISRTLSWQHFLTGLPSHRSLSLRVGCLLETWQILHENTNKSKRQTPPWYESSMRFQRCVTFAISAMNIGFTLVSTINYKTGKKSFQTFFSMCVSVCVYAWILFCENKAIHHIFELFYFQRIEWSLFVVRNEEESHVSSQEYDAADSQCMNITTQTESTTVYRCDALRSIRTMRWNESPKICI